MKHNEERCGCCEGLEILTPLTTANRPGLEALAYRVGTHATFLETMKARLSTHYLDIPLPEPDQTGQAQTARLHPLHGLKTRTGDDPTIALLDAWATVADVLTFYQERIANEGYLRTAVERRSILELARLVGYSLRPGVAASVFLAFTLEEGYEATIPASVRAQSLPRPGELPQSFETAEPLPARAAWNMLKPKLTQPQQITAETGVIYFEGISTNLKPNDPLLLVFGEGPDEQLLRRVEAVELQAAENRTRVTLQTLPALAAAVQAAAGPAAAARQIVEKYLDLDAFGVSPGEMAGRVMALLQHLLAALKPGMPVPELAELLAKVLAELQEEHAIAVEGAYTKLEPWVGGLIAELAEIERSLAAEMTAAAAKFNAAAVSPGLPSTGPAPRGNSVLARLAGYFTPLSKSASRPPANALRLGRSFDQALAPGSDLAPQLLTALKPELAPLLYQAWQNVPPIALPPVELYALRLQAAPFGHNALPRPDHFDSGRQMVVSGEWRIVDPLNLNITSPAASFLATPTGGTAPLEVHFFDRSTGYIESYAWNFGDGSTSSQRDPVHTFTSAGTFSVNLTVAGPAGSSSSTTTIMVEEDEIIVVNIGSSPGPGPAILAAAAVPGQPSFTYHQPSTLYLDAEYNIKPESWIVIAKPGQEPLRIKLGPASVAHPSLAGYGLSGKTTQLDLGAAAWIGDPASEPFSTVRGTTVLSQSEKLALAETPLDPVEEALCGQTIELAELYDGLEPGRWLIITGERTDLEPERRSLPDRGVAAGAEPDAARIEGVVDSELVMLAGVEQVAGPGEKTHTRLLLANPLAYCYKLDTVTIYGNVVKASHGETHSEVLGSGDASQALQKFSLRQSPLTYTAAPTPSGAASNLQLRVNDLLWHEANNLAELGANDHRYLTQTDDEGKTSLIFGNGQRGARLPTGLENVKAIYRSGIGKPGNVATKQISLLATRPLGVKGVINPRPASGGADPESRDQARRNAPLAVLALDRLVSVQDYADFARTFAGIGKASAARLSDGRRELVHVTIVGADDIPIETDSDLYRNLFQALRQFGDPYQPIRLDRRELLLLVISARVRLLPDYQWETIQPKIRAVLLERFSFERRDLGQDAILSEAISAIQTVQGVAYVDVDIFDGVHEKITPEELENLTNANSSKKLGLRERIIVNMAQVGPIQPAQLAYLSPQLPDTLLLTELTA
jgi:PKD repeat protein